MPPRPSAPSTRYGPMVVGRSLIARLGGSGIGPVMLPRPRQAIGLDPADQGSQRDAQEARGPRLVAAGLLEGGDDLLALQVLEPAAQGLLVAGGGRRRSCGRDGGMLAGGTFAAQAQVLDLDRLRPGAERDRPVDHVAQLADV